MDVFHYYVFFFIFEPKLKASIKWMFLRVGAGIVSILFAKIYMYVCMDVNSF